MNHNTLRRALALAAALSIPAFPLSAQDSAGQATAPEASQWAGRVQLPAGRQLAFSVCLRPAAGTITIPAQGAVDVPLDDVEVDERRLRFALRSVGAQWALDVAADGRSATGTLQQGGSFPVTLRRLAVGEQAEALRRPQHPEPPFPYDQEEVRIEHAAAGLVLAGTLTLPRGEGPFPAAVLVSGSGPQDRDETLFGHKPFLVLADHLTRRGIAVLRYDDRGCGDSTGDFAAATSDDFAADALAAVAHVRGHARIDGRRLGIIGHSEGGLIAPLCAAASPDLAFIVLLAGTGVPGVELLPLQQRLIAIASSVPAEEAAAQAAVNAGIFALVADGRPDAEVRSAVEAALRAAAPDGASAADLAAEVDRQLSTLLSPWFRRFLVLDPRHALRRVRCPVLALAGGKDVQVPPDPNLDEIREALAAGGNEAVVTRIFADCNHLFQTCKTGSPEEYGAIEQTMSPEVLEVIADWILALPLPRR